MPGVTEAAGSCEPPVPNTRDLTSSTSLVILPEGLDLHIHSRWQIELH
jgi:hypothetical protein